MTQSPRAKATKLICQPPAHLCFTPPESQEAFGGLGMAPKASQRARPRLQSQIYLFIALKEREIIYGIGKYDTFSLAIGANI